MYRIGLVGTGRWAEKIARTISEMPNEAKIVAVYQRSSKEISWLPKDCMVYDNFSDMLRKISLTHIITAIDPRGHYEIVEKATKYGLPVWLEKPIALSYEETKRIFDLDGDIFVDYIHLYSEAFQYLCNEIKNNKIDIIRTTGYGFGVNTNHNFSILYDYAVHDLSMLYNIVDNIKIENVLLTESKNGDNYQINMTSNECNVFTEVGNDRRIEKTRHTEIDIEEDTYLYDGLKQKVLRDGIEIFVAKELPLKNAIRKFLSGKQTNKDMTLKIMKTLSDIEKRVK